MKTAHKAAVVMDKYGRFLEEIDVWFRSVRVKYGDRMLCGRGCALCCSGLFDVPLPDALRVALGFQQLSPPEKKEVLVRSDSCHGPVLEAARDMKEPFFLDGLSEADIDRLADRFDDVRCPFLDNDDGCLIYPFRPAACILEGVPMVDARDGLFDDWCELNFTEGTDRTLEEDLALDYYRIETEVQRTTEILLELVPAFPRRKTSIFLPSIICGYNSFWSALVAEQSGIVLPGGDNAAAAPPD